MGKEAKVIIRWTDITVSLNRVKFVKKNQSEQLAYVQYDFRENLQTKTYMYV